MGKFTRLFICLGFIMILASCNQTDPTKEINQHLEETVEIEKSFEENQQHIFELEQKDEEIYGEILQFDSDDAEEIISLSEHAIELLGERAEYMAMEKETMKESQTEFEHIDPLIDDVKEEEIQSALQDLYDTMMERYGIYDKVYEQYMHSVQQTEELYQYFQEEHYSEKKMYETLEKVNDSYDEVAKIYQAFNDQTETFNEKKQTYYDKLGQ